MFEAKLFVLDSWPVLEWVYGKEPAASRFSALVNEASLGNVSLHMSRINLGEITYSLKRELDPTAAARKLAEVAALPITIVSVEDAHVDSAADLKAVVRFSYADAFATALSIAMNASLVTGDPEFLALQGRGVIDIEWMGA